MLNCIAIDNFTVLSILESPRLKSLQTLEKLDDYTSNITLSVTII